MSFLNQLQEEKQKMDGGNPILSNEIGFRHSINKTNFSTKSSLGLTLGRGSFTYGSGEFVDEPSLWDPSDTTSQEVLNTANYTLIRSPFIFSWSEKEDKLIIFGHIAPTLAIKDYNTELGLSFSIGANLKIKNNFGLCISPFFANPLDKHIVEYPVYVPTSRILLGLFNELSIFKNKPR